VERHVDEGAGRVLDRLEALVPALRVAELRDELVGDALVGHAVERVPLQHFGLERPVLEDLGGQLDEVAQDLRAREPLVGHLREQPVQAVTELVEQRARVVRGQERRRPGRGLREVVVVDDDGQRPAVDPRLVTVRAHPGAAPLRRPREVVGQEDAAHAIVAVAHFEDADVRMIGAKVGPCDEADAEQAMRRVEGRVQHAVEGEIRLQRGAVEAVVRLAHLFGVEAPVPRLDRVRLAVGQRRGPQRVAFACGASLGRLPHLREQPLDRRRRARHPVDQRIVGVIAVAVQARELGAQCEHLARERTVVVLAVVLAATDPRAERLLAQIAALGEGEERHDQRARQRDDGVRLVAALPGGGARRDAHVLGQAPEIPLAPERKAVARLVGQHVLAEPRRESGEALDDCGAARLGRLVEPRAGTLEVEVHALEEAQLLGGQVELVLATVEIVDAREERRVEIDGAVVGGETRRHLALDRLQRRRRLGGGEVVEQLLDAVELASAPIERRERVLEARGALACRDRVDLGEVRAQRPIERGNEVLGPDRLERRQPERRGPRLEQGVGVDRVHGGGCAAAERGVPHSFGGDKKPAAASAG
jgi:hypothetical protein